MDADNPPPKPADAPADDAGAASDRRLERRAAGLLLLLLALLCATALYIMQARGVFEPTQRVVLTADDSEGVVVGMNLTFSGFAIGRVQRIELTEDGNVRILVDVPRKDAHWLRTSSVFTLSRGLVGNTAIRAYSGVLTDPPLPDGAVRKVLAGDATAEIPKLMSSVRDILQNVSTLTAPDAALAGTLANTQAMTGKLNAPGGALSVLMGNPQDAAKLLAVLDRTNTALASVDQLLRRSDGLVSKADVQLFGNGGPGAPGGLVGDGRAAVAQINGLLGEARGSLKKVDGLLEEAQGAARNARIATTDLGTLRAEVEASLRKVENLVNEVNRKWPLARDTEVKLP